MCVNPVILRTTSVMHTVNTRMKSILIFNIKTITFNIQEVLSRLGEIPLGKRCPWHVTFGKTSLGKMIIAMGINRHFNPAGVICYFCICTLINYMSLPQQRLLTELSELGFETSKIYTDRRFSEGVLCDLRKGILWDKHAARTGYYLIIQLCIHLCYMR